MEATKMKNIGAFFLMCLPFFLTTCNCFGFWAPTSPSKIAHKSDYLVVGRVRQMLPDVEKQKVQVTLEILESFKGSAKVGQELTFEAPFSLHPDVITGDLYKIKGVETTNQLVKTGLFPLENSTNASHFVRERSLTNAIMMECVGYSSPHSFETNEVCAVFLKKSKDQSRLIMTMDSDGKYNVDWERHLFRSALTTDAWKPLDLLKPERLVPRVVSVSGTVRTPGEYQWTNGMTLYNAIALAGGITNDMAQAFISIYFQDELLASINGSDKETMSQRSRLEPGVQIVVHSPQNPPDRHSPGFVLNSEVCCLILMFLCALGWMIYRKQHAVCQSA